MSMKYVSRLIPILSLSTMILLIPPLSTSQPMPEQKSGGAHKSNTSTSSAAHPSRFSEPLDMTALEKGFTNPPDDSKIMMRWWWFGPSVSKRELEREMRAMKDAGIGGFEVQFVYPLELDDATTGIKNIPFLSDEFIDALRFVSEKARQLGLRMDLTLGSGWPYGGPQVPISDAAGRLRYVRVLVPEGSQRVAVPDISTGEKLIAVFLRQAEGQSAATEKLQEITNINDGAVWLPAGLHKSSELLFFISSRTGMMVKRPAVGAEGFVLNHLDRTATENYQKNVGDRLMLAFGQHPPYAVFCDSLEVYLSDWTPDFLLEFGKRRGYDLKPHLPSLVAATSQPNAEAVREDWGKTLTELFNERFAAPMHEWARRYRTLFRMQAYGTPPTALSSNSFSDLPEGEGSQWKLLRASRWASSASHLYGRSVTSSETWTWLHSPAFRATPLDMKAEAHLHFLLGINQLIGHGWPYTAEGIAYPGWRFYAAAVFNDKNPWSIVMPDIARYLQRLSFLLRQGQPTNDVAVYLPNNDAWAHFSPVKVNLIETLGERIGADVVATVLESGFNLDFVDDQAIEQLAHVEKNGLVLGKNKYSAVILPNVERIPLHTLQRLSEFSSSGGVVIATRHLPSIAPGFLSTEREHHQIQELSRHLFKDTSGRSHFVEDETKDLGSTLAKLVQPDVMLSPAAPEIGFVHRTLDGAEVYFLANSGSARRSVRATFRIQDMQPEWWDPVTASITTADVLGRSKEGITLELDIEPYGARVLVFSHRTSHGIPNLARSRNRNQGLSRIPSPIDLSTGWQVSFGQNGNTLTMQNLRSWTESDDTRYFSGVATYQKNVTVPSSWLQTNLTVRLDFGEGQPVPQQPLRSGMQAWLEGPVREAAIVYVNDTRAGSVWSPPYSLEVGKVLRDGENKIRIVVANLAMNYMAGHALPDYHLLNLRYGVRFEAQDMDKVQPIPSGLLGPIRLIATSSTDSRTPRN